MRKLEPQDHQGCDHPVGEDQLMAGSAALGAQTLMASAFAQPGLFPRHPRAGQLGDERPESTPRDARADTMPESRTGQGSLHNHPNPYGSPHVPDQPKPLSRTTPLAVTADARHFHLVERLTGHRVDVRVLHALEAATQTPALARFLAEVAGARYAAYKPFDFGAAARLPYLPRVRYRRTILAPARWLLTAEELPGRAAEQGAWDWAFDVWRTRLPVPSAVSMIEDDQRLPVDLTHPVHRRLLRNQLDRSRRLELREAPAADAHGWIGRAHEVWVSLRRTGPVPAAEGLLHGSAPYSAQPLHLPGAGSLLYTRLHAHPGRYDEILTQFLPALLAALGDTAPLWWFTRHRETARPDADQYLDLVLHLAPGTYAVAAECVHDWVGALHRTGLAAGLTLTDYRPQTGRFGQGDAMDAAHQVFAADSVAALAQIRFTDQTDTVTPQALAAASAVDLVQHLAASEAEGINWLVQRLPQTRGRLDPHLRDQVLDLTSPGGRDALGVLPGGNALTLAWQARAAALDAYQLRLAGADPLRAARSLLHQHHVRALGVDPTAEALTLRLARTAALRRQKAVR